MIDVNQLRKGTTFSDDGQIYKVLSYWHNKPGRGSATIRVSVRDMRSGAIKEMTFNSGIRVQDIEVEKQNVQFLYDDGEFLTFMNTETYEQPQLKRELFGDDVYFLKENGVITLNTFEDEIIDYELPINIDLRVIESEMGFAGDTANNPVKKVTVETGLEVSVPLFINAGDLIRVKTEDNSYVTRDNL
jgi:elongation factor P